MGLCKKHINSPGYEDGICLVCKIEALSSWVERLKNDICEREALLKMVVLAAGGKVNIPDATAVHYHSDDYQFERYYAVGAASTVFICKNKGDNEGE